MKICSTHFSFYEVRCKCGCGYANVDERLLETAEDIRALWGRPVIVHSLCRCPAWNYAIGGALNSRHIHGQAIDFHVQGLTPVETYASILAAWKRGYIGHLGGLFRYGWGVHVDVRPLVNGELTTQIFD